MVKKMCYVINKDNLCLHKKQDNARLLFRKDFEEYDYDIKNTLGWYYPNYCYATIIDNKIISCASAGHHANRVSDKIIDISTKTHEDYRKKGYSVSNVVALCEYIFNMQEEKEMLWITDINNIASQKTAISAGFTKVSYIYFLFRKLKAKLGM